jgi:ABC-type antimicrobial peptide transport system permease subunit
MRRSWRFGQKNEVNVWMITTDKMINVVKTQKDKHRKFKEMQMTEFLTQTPETEIYVEIHNDSIWRHTKQNGKLIGDYFMIQKNNGILNYYDKSKSVNYKKYDLFAQKNKYEIIENELAAGKYKDYVSKMDYSDHKVEIDKLNKIINSIRKTGVIMVLVFVIIAIIVTFNSIRLTMYTYRTEVEIMKLVGASNWFIRLRFITEGVLYGVFAALMVGIVWYPLARYFAPFFINAGIQINTVQLLHQNIVYILGIQLLIGVLLGVISSFIAIRRYLKA